MKYQGIWRRKPTETLGFPKLMVQDNVVSGSINIRGTRVPLWAIVPTVISDGWEQAENNWAPEKRYGYTKQDLVTFLYCLLEQRGEFGRLLLLLARVEKLDSWWDNAKARRRVKQQLQNCLDALNEIESEP